jgi:hypothetical protein
VSAAALSTYDHPHSAFFVYSSYHAHPVKTIHIRVKGGRSAPQPAEKQASEKLIGRHDKYYFFIPTPNWPFYMGACKIIPAE